jgi:hypothetical protein
MVIVQDAGRIDHETYIAEPGCVPSGKGETVLAEKIDRRVALATQVE